MLTQMTPARQGTLFGLHRAVASRGVTCKIAMASWSKPHRGDYLPLLHAVCSILLHFRVDPLQICGTPRSQGGAQPLQSIGVAEGTSRTSVLHRTPVRRHCPSRALERHLYIPPIIFAPRCCFYGSNPVPERGHDCLDAR